MKRNAVAWVALVVSAAALVSSRGVTRQLPAAPKVPAESQKAAHALSEAFGAVAEFVKPSVVQISVERKGGGAPALRGRRSPFPGLPGPNGPQNLDPKELEEMLRRFFGPGVRPEREQFGRQSEGIGSGFVYDDRGHILTNNHVVENAGKITVTFYDGVEVTAKVVGTDPQTDVAVIKVDKTDYRPLSQGLSGKLKVGELVMAIGSPYHLEQSVTTGIISATDRNSVGINDYESFIQTDAAINPGNSGGPLSTWTARSSGSTRPSSPAAGATTGSASPSPSTWRTPSPTTSSSTARSSGRASASPSTRSRRSWPASSAWARRVRAWSSARCSPTAPPPRPA